MSAVAPNWSVLGFTSDDVVGAWQDSRIAGECARAWQAAGKPPGFEIFQAAGDARFMILWFVSETLARLLDAHHVDWRRFLVGQCAAPPDGAWRAVAEESSDGEARLTTRR